MLGLAMVFVLLTYGGWNEAAYISAELKAATRDRVRAAVASLAIVAVCYLVVNLALLSGSVSPVSPPATRRQPMSWGGRSAPTARNALALFVAVAALTSINATMIVGARTNYAMGARLAGAALPGRLGRRARARRVAAYLFQGVVALALVVFGAFQHDGFEAMVEFTAPVFWGFLLLVGIALFVLRTRDRRRQRPFRVPLYPVDADRVLRGRARSCCYSSVAYAASNDAVHISLLVMAAGIVALITIRVLSGRRRA